MWREQISLGGEGYFMHPFLKVKQNPDIKCVLTWPSVSSHILILCFNEEQWNSKLGKRMYIFSTTRKDPCAWTIQEAVEGQRGWVLSGLGAINSFYWIYSLCSKKFCLQSVTLNTAFCSIFDSQNMTWSYKLVCIFLQLWSQNHRITEW